jgi:hypothetical protein
MTTRIGAGVPDEKPALVMGDSGLTWTFGELQRRTDEAVAMLAAHGLGCRQFVTALPGAAVVTVSARLVLVGELDAAGRGLAVFDAQQQ